MKRLKKGPKKPVPAIKVSGECVTVNLDETQPKTFGSTNPIFHEGFITQLMNISSKGSEINEKASNYSSSIIGAIEPQNELEALLALQMVAIHNATMTMARRLAHVDTLPQQDSAERALNKLARTYSMQLEALRKYRSGGKQKVVVKHVHVNEGGQANVGNIEQSGGG